MNLSYFKTMFIVAMFIIASNIVSAELKEYFGRFIGEPSFTVKTSHDDRPTFILQDSFHFIDPNGFEWIAPKGWEVDGATIPQFAWSMIGGPMSGKYIHASIIHDYYCDTKSRTAHDTHRNFYYGMKSKGVPDSKANLMYWAVRTFGPSWKIVKRVVKSNEKGQPIYKQVLESVSKPIVTDEKLEELIMKVNSEKDITRLDLLSDSVRKQYGSEQLQQRMPILIPPAQKNMPIVDPLDKGQLSY